MSTPIAPSRQSSKTIKGNILEQIAAKTRNRIAQDRMSVPDSVIEEQAYKIAQRELIQNTTFRFPFEEALSKPGTSFICEVKKASPSKGIIAKDFPYLEIAKAYEKAGASAISCLTEPYYFLGSNKYLKDITDTVSIPVLRKDFTIDTRMIYEAKVLGASAILLICSLLDDRKLTDYLALAHQLGLSCLVETHNASEIERALRAGARIIGVNNRNLTNFEVDTSHSLQLRKYAGTQVLFVSESGITTRNDVAQLEALGVDAVLVGETLMRSTNKEEKLAELRGDANPSTTHPNNSSTKHASVNTSSPINNVSFSMTDALTVCVDPTKIKANNRFSPEEIIKRQKDLHTLFAKANSCYTENTELSRSSRTHTLQPCYIKACGMKRTEDIQAVNRIHPDFCGFVIEYPKSSRNVSAQHQIDLAQQLDPNIYAVGVFVDAPIDLIVYLAEIGSIDAVQLHGTEDESYLADLRSRCTVPLIKAFQIKPNDSESTIKTTLHNAHNSTADMILIDSGMGSGTKFNWSLLPYLKRPYFLAGGLTPQTIPEAREQLNPWGIDMSSGLETNGVKDEQKIKAATAAARNSFYCLEQS